MTPGPAYTFGTELPVDVGAARERVVAALAAEGFGVLTEIDVAAVMKAKLEIDSSPYLILGACNPLLAHRALGAEPSIGALLPCNVVLRAAGNGTLVEVMDPEAIMGITSAPEIEKVAAEASERLRRAVEALAPLEEDGQQSRSRGSGQDRTNAPDDEEVP